MSDFHLTPEEAKMVRNGLLSKMRLANLASAEVTLTALENRALVGILADAAGIGSGDTAALLRDAARAAADGVARLLGLSAEEADEAGDTAKAQWCREFEASVRACALMDPLGAGQPAPLTADEFAWRLKTLWDDAHEETSKALWSLRDFPAWGGATKDLLMELGMTWSPEANDYVFPRTK